MAITLARVMSRMLQCYRLLICVSSVVAIPERACVTHTKSGDLILGGIFPVYRSASSVGCDGILFSNGVKSVEVMAYAVETINNRTDVLPNVRLGYEIRNDCAKEKITLWTMMTMTTAGGQLDYQEYCPEHERPDGGKIIGVVGPSFSSTSLYAAKVGGLSHVPVVSYVATSDELSDAERFPYFLRTVPPDKFQVGAIVDLLLHFDWRYVALFYSIDTYGIHGARQIQTLSEKTGICIAVNVPVASYPTETELEDIADKLIEHDKVNVIVMFGGRRTSYAVMEAIEHVPRRFTIVGGDGFGTRIARDGYGPITHGGIFIRLFNPGDETTRAYFETLPYKQSTSQWYRDYLDETTAGLDCVRWSTCPIPAPHLETLIQDGVYALAYAADAVIRTRCSSNGSVLCDEVFNGETQLAHLLNVTFEHTDGSIFSFDENGDTSGKYIIRNMQLVDDDDENEYQLVDVGIWDPHDTQSKLNIQEDIMQWLPYGVPPVSLCIEQCERGYISVPLKKKCCMGCQPCPHHAYVLNGSICVECSRTAWPDGRYESCLIIEPLSVKWTDAVILLILALSVLGILLCGLATGGIWYYRNHQLVKATSRELSSVNLLGLSFAFLCSCMLILYPTARMCMWIEIIISLCFTLSFAPILLKVNRIWRIFAAAKKSVKSPKFTGPKHQLILTTMAVSVQVIIALFSALFGPTVPEYLFPAERKKYLEIYCKFGYGFLASCLYNLLLIITCCYFAFRARKVPSNYNESKFIAISVYSTLLVCLAAVPVYSTAVEVMQKVSTLCMALLLNAYLTLVCIYLPKLYAIHFAGDEDLTLLTWRANTVSGNQVQPTAEGQND